MPDKPPTEETEPFTLLRGPDGAVYMFSESNLKRHRVPKDVEPALLEAYGSQSGAAGRASKDLGAFRILGTGSIARSRKSLSPIDTWVDGPY